MSCDWSLIGLFLEPIRINHVIQNIIMVIIFEYIIYVKFECIEIIMYNIYIEYCNTIFHIFYSFPENYTSCAFSLSRTV